MRASLLLLCVLLALQLSSQTGLAPKTRHLEGGILLGISNYSGDLSEKNIQISASELAYGAFARYFLSNHFSLRAHLFLGSISGEDAHAKDLLLQQRSFRFKTNILELGLGGEFHLFGVSQLSSTEGDSYLLLPYLYLGVGGAFTSKKVDYYGAPADRSKFEVVPLPEGGKHQQFLVIPMGIGVRANVNRNMVLGLEVGWRPAFSDDLDGVSINGNPDKKDWYYFGGATFAFILNQQKRSKNPVL